MSRSCDDCRRVFVPALGHHRLCADCWQDRLASPSAPLSDTYELVLLRVDHKREVRVYVFRITPRVGVPFIASVHRGHSGRVIDIQTSDGFTGRTGDPRLDALLVRRVIGYVSCARALRDTTGKRRETNR